MQDVPLLDLHKWEQKLYLLLFPYKKNMNQKFINCFSKMKSTASKRNWLLNWGFNSSLKVVRKYLKGLRPYSCEMLVHKHAASTIFVVGCTSLRHLFKKSTLSLTPLLICFKYHFRRVSQK